MWYASRDRLVFPILTLMLAACELSCSEQTTQTHDVPVDGLPGESSAVDGGDDAEAALQDGALHEVADRSDGAASDAVWDASVDAMADAVGEVPVETASDAVWDASVDAMADAVGEVPVETASDAVWDASVDAMADAVGEVPVETASDAAVDTDTETLLDMGPLDSGDLGPDTSEAVACQPDCNGKECGDDGCGGECGPCAEGFNCLGAACVADGGEIWVDDDNIGDVLADGSKQHPYWLIQDAVDQAVPGSIIRVAAGTYTGGIVLDVPYLALSGESKEGVVISGPKLFEVLKVEASGALVEHVTLSGGAVGIWAHGTYEAPLETVTLSDVAVSALEGGKMCTQYTVEGICVEKGGITKVVGISISHAGSVVVDECTVASLAGAYSWLGGDPMTDLAFSEPVVGMALKEVNGCKVSDLRVEGVSGATVYMGDAGEAIGVDVTGSQNCTFTRTEVSGVAGGFGKAIVAVDADGVGFRMQGCTDVLVENSVVRDISGATGDYWSPANGRATGVLAKNSENLEIRSCSIRGIVGTGGAGGPGVGVRIEGEGIGNVVDNSIIAATSTYCVAGDGTGLVEYCALYSCGDAQAAGVVPEATCLDADPEFVDEANGDLHLKATSPCIDAGDPLSPYDEEPSPNGCRIDIGAYGNTPEATSAPGAPHCAP